MKKIHWFYKGCIIIIMLCGQTFLYSQCATYKLSDRGDTLNCKDKAGKKQGAWLESYPELRGNPAYELEGEYENDKKQGIWRKYSQQGDLLYVESYRWGLLDGKSQYYSLMGLEREEGWWAIDPTKEYDTLEVPDLFVDGAYRTVIVKNEGRSMRHGTWMVYDPMSGRIQKSEEYFRDSAIGVLGTFGLTAKKGGVKEPLDSVKKKIEKPDVVKEWEEKNKGKKKVKVRTGSTGY